MLPAPDSIIQRLRCHAEQTPTNTAISFLQASGTSTPVISSTWSYSTLNSAVEYLATRLLPPENSLSKSRLIPKLSHGSELVRGDRILLVYPPCSPHFIISFLACIRAGLVAVPTYPPHPARKDSLLCFAGIVKGCGARVALTNGDYANIKRVNELREAFWSKVKKKKEKSEHEEDAVWPEDLQWVVTDAEPLESPPPPPQTLENYSLDSSELAFLQYTSGSTSAPKGVMISHGNLVHNLSIITNELQASNSTIVVSWLPQYHDMGLIGSLLGIIYCGGSGFYMSPIAFLQRPMGWIEAVSKYRATHLQSPDFAFSLTARKFNSSEYYYKLTDRKDAENKKLKPLDLSCLQHIINGAEPVTLSAIEAFVNAFQPFGLPTDPNVIYPTYGLAEHTVFVCSGGRGKLTVNRKLLEEENRVVVASNECLSVSNEQDVTATLLGCGFPMNQNVDVQIVDPKLNIPCGEDSVGEIWINSPSKALGYFGNDDITKRDFHATLSDNSIVKKSGSSILDTSTEYLRSGDLGFLHNGELFICGRLKDLIIVGGRNYYPADLEAIAESVTIDRCRPGCSAAFSTRPCIAEKHSGEGEEVVLLMELNESLKKSESVYKEIIQAVRSEISKEFSLSLSLIVLLKKGTVPKTTSGKISRSKAQREFLKGNLDEIYRTHFKECERKAKDSHIESCATTSTHYNPSSDFLPSQPLESSPSSAKIRALDKGEIQQKLLEAICQISNIDRELVTDTAPLNTFMDSVSLAQLKGMLEGQYSIKTLSDDYLFQDSTTLKKLVEIVKTGEVRENVASISEGRVGHDTGNTSNTSQRNQTGNFGCPPGVVCCTIA